MNGFWRLDRVCSRTRRLCTLLIVLAASGKFGAAADGPESPPRWPVEITTVQGTTVTGQLASWSENRLEVFGERTQTVSASEVLSIRFVRAPGFVSPGTYVILTNRDRFAISAAAIADDQFTASWTTAPLRPQLSFPLEFVAGLAFDQSPSPRLLATRLARFDVRQPGHDTLQPLNGDEIEGELQGYAGGLLEVKTSLGTTRLDERRLRQVTLDPELGQIPEFDAPWWIVLLSDGARISTQRLVPRNDQSVQIQPLAGEAFLVPWTELLACWQAHLSVSPLSTRTPAEISHEPFLGNKTAPGTGKNVFAEPLSIAGREYVDGVGMAGGMRVIYDVLPGDMLFHASVGIDDASRQRGSVIFRVERDSQVVWSSPLMERGAPALRIPPVSLSGHRRLTLISDYATGGDAGDIADWCDAVVIARPTP